MSRFNEWLWMELRPERLVWTAGSIGLVAVMLLALVLWAREFDPRDAQTRTSPAKLEAVAPRGAAQPSFVASPGDAPDRAIRLAESR